MIAIPFNKDYSKNRHRYNQSSDNQPCIICGKLVKDQNQRYSVHVHDGGISLVTEEEATTMDEASDCGFYPIGPDCLRQHPELRPYVHDAKAPAWYVWIAKDPDQFWNVKATRRQDALDYVAATTHVATTFLRIERLSDKPKQPKCSTTPLDWQALYFDLYRQANGENAPDCFLYLNF